jgi:hypothetical protein
MYEFVMMRSPIIRRIKVTSIILSSYRYSACLKNPCHSADDQLWLPEFFEVVLDVFSISESDVSELGPLVCWVAIMEVDELEDGCCRPAQLVAGIVSLQLFDD